MKKGKLLLSIMGICMALAVLCFGVYASAIPHRYGLGGNIGYKVTDAYVQIATTTYKYSTSKIDLASTLRTCAKGLETKTITQLNSDVVVDGKTLTRVGRVGGVYDTLQDPHSEYATLDDESITFSTEVGSECYAYFYVLNVKNLSSSAPVYVKVTDNSQTLWDNYACNMYHYRTEDIVGLTSTDTTNNNIVIGFALIDETSEFEDVDFSYDVEVGIAEKYNPLKADAEREYYYVEMGNWYGVPVRYRLVATNQSANFANGETDFVYYNNSFNANVLPHDINGVFIQETCSAQLYKVGSSTVGTYNERSAVSSSVSSTTLTSTRFGTSNNYFSSIVRNYLIGNNVNKSGIADAEPDTNFLSDCNISISNYIYSNIQGRKLSDMTTTRGTFSSSTNGYKYTVNGSVDIPSGVSGTTQDKLWLLSHEEIGVILANRDPYEDRDSEYLSHIKWGLKDDVTTKGTWWLTRTAQSNDIAIYGVDGEGTYYSEQCTTNIMSVRPAFQLAL
jgi:hypothetical protein